MELLIPNSYEDDFYSFIIKYIEKIGIGRIDRKKLINWDLYFNSFSKLTNIFKKNISSYEIIVSGIYNLIYVKREREVVIKIDPSQKLPGINAKINILCNTINNGNLIVKGYPIFTDLFTYISNNLDSIHLLYELTGGFLNVG